MDQELEQLRAKNLTLTQAVAQNRAKLGLPFSPEPPSMQELMTPAAMLGGPPETPPKRQRTTASSSPSGKSKAAPAAAPTGVTAKSVSPLKMLSTSTSRTKPAFLLAAVQPSGPTSHQDSGNTSNQDNPGDISHLL